MALVRLCILMAGSLGTAIDFIANCIQPCRSLSRKVLVLCTHLGLPANTQLQTARVYGVYSDVLIRSVNSARKWVVHEDNKCIANLKIIGTACFSRSTQSGTPSY